MLRDASPQLPNIWNFGGKLPDAQKGIMFPVAEDTTIKSEAYLFEKLHESLSGLGVHPDNITLSTTVAL